MIWAVLVVVYFTVTAGLGMWLFPHLHRAPPEVREHLKVGLYRVIFFWPVTVPLVVWMRRKAQQKIPVVIAVSRKVRQEEP